MKNDPSRRNRLICKDRPVPDGWVVVGHTHSPACPGADANAWVIKRPGKVEVVWESSPVPDGYARVRRSRTDHCPGDGDNAWVIERSPSPNGTGGEQD